MPRRAALIPDHFLSVLRAMFSLPLELYADSAVTLFHTDYHGVSGSIC